MYYVYRITNKVNSKFYYGVHKSDIIPDPNYWGSGKLISLAIKKYGMENFTMEVIETFLSKDDAYSLEREIVNDELVESNMCYNMKVGGIGGVHLGNANRLGIPDSEETKKTKREAFKNSETHAQHLKCVSTETKNKRSKMMKDRYEAGYQNPFCREDIIEKLRQVKIGRKRMYKGNEFRMATPGTDRWNNFILEGYVG